MEDQTELVSELEQANKALKDFAEYVESDDEIDFADDDFNLFDLPEEKQDVVKAFLALGDGIDSVHELFGDDSNGFKVDEELY